MEHSTYLSQCPLHHNLLPAASNPFEPGVEQQVLLCGQLGMLDVKLWTHPQVIVDVTDLRGEVITRYSGNAGCWLVQSCQHRDESGLASTCDKNSCLKSCALQQSYREGNFV